ncbi:MAG: hypothetical protein IJ680_09365, partial [Paludibacteraceae bacterium]|nr:hypothetical protein [Paludibacteraceae bacterium]
VAASVRDLLDSRNRTVEKSGPDFWQKSQNRWNSRTYSLTLTYSFSSKNAKKSNKQERDENMENFFDEGGADD